MVALLLTAVLTQPAAPVVAPVPLVAPVPKDDPAAVRAHLMKLAAAYNSLTPEAAAAALKELIDAGKLDVAAKILTFMKERSAARAIEALDDPATAVQLIERMRAAKSLPVAPSPRRPGAPAPRPAK